MTYTYFLGGVCIFQTLVICMLAHELRETHAFMHRLANLIENIYMFRATRRETDE